MAAIMSLGKDWNVTSGAGGLAASGERGRIVDRLRPREPREEEVDFCRLQGRAVPSGT